MESLRIDILNPKARKLINELAELNLIKISSDNPKTDFFKLLQKLRKKDKNVLSLDEISKEVEEVRKKRCE